MPTTISIDPNCLDDLKPAGVIPRAALNFGPQVAALVAEGSKPKASNNRDGRDERLQDEIAALRLKLEPRA
jgi:hypothetical protein